MKKLLPVLLFLGAVLASPLENGLVPKMVYVDGGVFNMGSSEPLQQPTERVHEVTLRSFYLSETEVTQSLYETVMKKNPSRFVSGDNPVEQVSWFDAVMFCNALNEQLGLPAVYAIEGENIIWNRDSKGFRLPTEAEWEYAARGGSQAPRGEILEAGFCAGLKEDVNPADAAWFNVNSGRRAQPVKKKLPNALGLYDMSGNVWEWCWDWFADYPVEPSVNPSGPVSGKRRILRGGSWFNMIKQISITYRHGSPSADKGHSMGFRLARNS